ITGTRDSYVMVFATDLAATADYEDLGSTFLALGQKEKRHKLALEKIYDEEVLTED
ncbi:unnamed protein product, partial [marine sediment metagenome]